MRLVFPTARSPTTTSFSFILRIARTVELSLQELCEAREGSGFGGPWYRMGVGSILRFGGPRGRFWVTTTCEPRKRLWRGSRLPRGAPERRGPRADEEAPPT